VRNLGVLLDSMLTFDKHVANIRRVSFCYLRMIARVRPFLSCQQTLLLLNALVMSRIEFCASLLLNLSKKQQKQLQAVLHYAIKLLDHVPKRLSVKQTHDTKKMANNSCERSTKTCHDNIYSHLLKLSKFSCCIHFHSTISTGEKSLISF
jgi:hypothetical protein